MERIEIPATVYWQSSYGKRFTTQEDCEKYEQLYPKWQNPVRYRELENVEGQLCCVYWVESVEELEEAIWFTHTKLNVSTCNHVRLRSDVEFRPQWIIACPDYNEYNAEMAIYTLEDFREVVDETLKAAQDTISEVIKLIWEKV
jgi:hypothetical protein